MYEIRRRDEVCPPLASQIEVGTSHFTQPTEFATVPAMVKTEMNLLLSISVFGGRVAVEVWSSTCSAKPCHALKPEAYRAQRPSLRLKTKQLDSCVKEASSFFFTNFCSCKDCTQQSFTCNRNAETVCCLHPSMLGMQHLSKCPPLTQNTST